MAKKPQIPLAEVMKAIDKKDRGWYNRLSAEQKKAFSAWMMMRYASSVCLLYTSPSPRDKRQSRMPSSA